MNKNNYWKLLMQKQMWKNKADIRCRICENIESPTWNSNLEWTLQMQILWKKKCTQDTLNNWLWKIVDRQHIQATHEKIIKWILLLLIILKDSYVTTVARYLS